MEGKKKYSIDLFDTKNSTADTRNIEPMEVDDGSIRNKKEEKMNEILQNLKIEDEDHIFDAIKKRIFQAQSFLDDFYFQFEVNGEIFWMEKFRFSKIKDRLVSYENFVIKSNPDFFCESSMPYFLKFLRENISNKTDLCQHKYVIEQFENFPPTWTFCILDKQSAQKIEETNKMLKNMPQIINIDELTKKGEALQYQEMCMLINKDTKQIVDIAPTKYNLLGSECTVCKNKK